MTSISSDRRQGLNSSAAFKVPCRAATTAAIVLSGLQTVDTVVLVAGDRVLVKDQASSAANGIYVADTGNWTRDLDFDGAYDVLNGSMVFITGGGTNAATVWQAVATNPVTPGTTSITFVQGLFSGLGSTSFTQGGTGATARSMQTKVRERVSPQDFGAVGNGVTNDQAAMDYAVAYCKATGFNLYVPSGKYNAAFNLNWCVPKVTADAIIAASAGNQGAQGTVGYNFNVDLEADAQIMLDSTWGRLKKMSVKGGHFLGNIIVYLEQMCSFADIACDKVIAYAEKNGSVIPAGSYLTWDATATSAEAIASDCLWGKWDNCQAQALVVYSTISAHNVHSFTDCVFTGATSANMQVDATQPYLNHHGASRYFSQTAGQGQGFTFTGCDFSYSDLPLYNATAYPCNDIGCYYEGLGWNFYTADGETISPYVANILGGFNYSLVKQPDGTLTLSAATVGAGRTATASVDTFVAADVGKEIRLGSGAAVAAGRATITGYTSGLQVTVTVDTAFSGVGPHAANAWTLGSALTLQTGVHGMGFHLIAPSVMGSEGLIELNPQGGLLTVRDISALTDRAALRNLSGYEPTFGGAPVWEFFGDQIPYNDSGSPAARFGNRKYRNWTELKTSRLIQNLAAGATTTFISLSPLQAATAYEGNLFLKIVCVGGVNSATAQTPVFYLGHSFVTGLAAAAVWAAPTALLGSNLIGTHVTVVLTPGAAGSGALAIAVNNTSAGRFTGELFVEAIVSSMNAATEFDLARWELATV